MATFSSTLVWKSPWTEEPGRLQSMRSQRVGNDQTHTHTHTFPSPGDLPDPEIKLGSPTLQADALSSESPGKHNKPSNQ